MLLNVKLAKIIEPLKSSLCTTAHSYRNLHPTGPNYRNYCLRMALCGYLTIGFLVFAISLIDFYSLYHRD
jgi:hypothetical protein